MKTLHDIPQSPYQLYVEYQTLTNVVNEIAKAMQEPILANCLVGIELTAAIFENFYQDARIIIDKDQALERTSQCLTNQFDLLARCFAAQSFHCPTVPSFSKIAFPTKLRLLTDMPESIGQKTLRHYEAVAVDFPFALGFESQLNNANVDKDKPIIDYNCMQPIVELHRKNLSHCETPEDYLFCIIHQITECWLNVFHIYFEKAFNALTEKDYIGCKNMMLVMNSILDFLIKCIELLDLMAHSDYHPLRVKLRDASGSQSVKARNARQVITHLAELFQDNLRQRDITLLDMLRYSKDYSSEYICFSVLLKLIKGYRGFLLNHFLLASNTIGQHTIGSIGYEVNQLAVGFLKPLVPDFEKALYDFTILTNFEHSEVSGEIIMYKQQELKPDFYQFDVEPCVLSKSLMKVKAVAYFHALQRKEIDVWLGLFDQEHCQFKEHLTSKPYIGIAQIKTFVTTFLSIAKEMYYIFRGEEYQDNSIIIKWDVVIKIYNDKILKFSGYEKLFFNAQYLITSVESGWDADKICKQLAAKDENHSKEFAT